MIHFRPIIRAVTSFISNETKLSTEKITSENFQFSVKACIKFSAKYLIKKQFIFNTSLIADPYYGRVVVKNPKHVLTCRNNVLCCNNYTIAMAKNLDFVRYLYAEPIMFRFHYFLFRSEQENNVPEFPEIALNNPRSDTLQVPFEMDCGNDQICQPQLKLTAWWISHNDTFILGSNEHIDAQITVRNHGEHAYSCILEIKYNVPLFVLPEICVEVRQGLLRCVMGNPLRTNAEVCNLFAKDNVYSNNSSPNK